MTLSTRSFNILSTSCCLLFAMPALAQQQALTTQPRSAAAVAFVDSVIARVGQCDGFAWGAAMAIDMEFLQIDMGKEPDSLKTKKANAEFDSCVHAAKQFLEANFRTIRDAGHSASAVAALKDFYAYVPTALSSLGVGSSDLAGSNTSHRWRARANVVWDEFQTRATRVKAEF